MSNHEDYLGCPICKDLLLIPRLYPCGHNICEECMITNDKTVSEETLGNSVPIYSCPLCRHQSLGEWHTRPVNTSLIDVLCKLSMDYKIQHESYKKKTKGMVETVTIPKNLNLAYLCKNIREKKANDLYDQIIPLLYSAAIEGKSYITINVENINIHHIADLVADKLIKQNGIYKLVAGRQECQIELIPSDRSYRFEYENQQYNSTDPLMMISTDSPSDDSSGSSESANIHELSGYTGAVVSVTVQDSDNTHQQQHIHSQHLGNFLVNRILHNLSQTQTTEHSNNQTSSNHNSSEDVNS